MNAINLGERDDYMSKTAIPLEQFKRRYKNWLETYVDVNGVYESFITDVLFDTPFTYTLEEDAHRYADGEELRNQYSESSGEIISAVDANVPWPCSVLEVLVSLAMAMEYMDDTGHDVTYFYHELLDNLGIDKDFQEGDWDRKFKLVHRVVQKWLDRRYGKDGRGGIFPLDRPREDQRNVELWYQMNAYMIEKY